MTDETDITNLALQSFGSRTTVTAGEVATGTGSNEAIQAALCRTRLRDDLMRMAPWDCALNTANLTYISSVPGTPENTSPATTLWQKGQPSPPWAYEYQYPVDCLKACWIIPGINTGFTGVPITTAVTGGAATYWSGPPVKFKVGVDQFYPVTAAVDSAAGLGYAAGDLIILAAGPTTSAPIGAPAVLQVATIGVGGAVATVNVVNQIQGSSTPLGGSYFSPQTNPVAQGSTTGAGTGATFTLTFGTQGDQRVILTNQEFATLAYVKQVTNPNVMDPLFQKAWYEVLGAYLCVALSGDKALANMCIGRANDAIAQARKADANEGLVINDVTPDWIRARGISYSDIAWTPNFDWGGSWPSF